MPLRSTPTLAICLAGGLAAGIALARPATPSNPSPVVDAAPGVEQPIAETPVEAIAAMSISDFTFTTVTASPGAVVTVGNADSAPHTTTSTDGLFDTGNIAGGADGAFTAPSTPGAYALFCAIHPAMQGQLIVA
ncbi:MAG: cupredoxin domain-containing protein [Ilumatobacter sp.]|uniref:cupredoxin domain-containing protein n=1 Tax=Ilumatobacter sp. TaxID=1967498 RepID=UPI003C7670C6